VGKGLTNPYPGRTDRQDVFDAFTRGEVGMLNGHPTLMQQVDDKGVKYGTAPLPSQDGLSGATTGVADWMMAFKKRGHREAVGKFLDFAYSEKNVLQFADQYDLLPVTTSAYEAMRADKKHRKLWEFLAQQPTAVYYPVYNRSWGSVAADLKESIGRVVERDGDPASMLGQLQREADATEDASESSE
jgi:multiple sugar transport system substrate-binding protein